MDRVFNNEYGLAENHRYLYNSLIRLDQVCKENNIKYSLHGGTLLGAERDGHFIPWDDDADISMIRSQFEQLKNVISNKINGFSIVEGDEEAPYVSRIVDNTQENGKYNIDVFIWDYVTGNKIGQFLKINYIRFLQGTLKGNIDYSAYKGANRVMVCLAHIAGLPFTKKFKLRYYSFISRRLLTGKKECIHRSNDAFVGVSYVFDSDYMKEYANISLEGYDFMVSKRYREFLERNYGKNYMIPPSESNRGAEHSSIRKQFIPEEDKNKKFGILR